MLQSDMMESKPEALEIDDIHQDILMDMLQYIYTGNNKEEMGKIMCISHLHKFLTPPP